MTVLESKMKIMKESVVAYIDLVEQMLDTVSDGIQNKKTDSLKLIIDELEPQANSFQQELAQHGLALLALYHPEASHLRAIIKMAGMGTDLERMADMVTKIALSAYHWSEDLDFVNYPKIFDMIKEVKKMINDLRLAFIDENILLCVAVIQHDDRVDELNKQVIKTLIKQMNATDQVEALIQLLNIARFLERMADHCTHLAEDIIFIKEGLVPNKDTK